MRSGGRQVEVDLGLNAAANARVRHEARKRHTAKQRRTVEANARALAAAEKRTTQQLAQVGPRPRRGRARVRGEKQVGVPAHDIHRAERWRFADGNSAASHAIWSVPGGKSIFSRAVKASMHPRRTPERSWGTGSARSGKLRDRFLHCSL